MAANLDVASAARDLVSCSRHQTQLAGSDPDAAQALVDMATAPLDTPADNRGLDLLFQAIDRVVPDGPVAQRTRQSSSLTKRPMRGGPGTDGYITIVVPGVDLSNLVKNMAKSGHTCAYEAMRDSCCHWVNDKGVMKYRGDTTHSVENISWIIRRAGWPEHVDGAPLTVEMVVAAHMWTRPDVPDGTPLPKAIRTNCFILDVQMGPIAKYKVHAHLAERRDTNTYDGVYVQLPGVDGVSLHMEAIVDTSIRNSITRYMGDDPFGVKTVHKAPLGNVATASDVVVEAVVRHDREETKKRTRQAVPHGPAVKTGGTVKEGSTDDYLFADDDEHPYQIPDGTTQDMYPMYYERDRIIEVDGTGNAMCKEPLHAPLAGGWFWYNIFMPGPLTVIDARLKKKVAKPKKNKKQSNDGDDDPPDSDTKKIVVCVTGVHNLNELYEWLVRYCGVDDGRFTAAKANHGQTSRVSMLIGRYSVVCTGDVPLADLLTLHRLKFEHVPFMGHTLAIYADAMLRLSIRDIGVDGEVKAAEVKAAEVKAAEKKTTKKPMTAVQSSLDFASSYPVDL